MLSDSPSTTPSSTTPSTPYAGFWRRAGGHVIDYLVIVGIFAATAGSTSILFGANASAWLLPLALVFVLGYYVLMNSAPWQATVGKLCVQIKVTDLAGRRIGIGRSVGRALANVITIFTFWVGYSISVLTKRKQTLHDKIAKTLVVRRQYSPEEIATAGPMPAMPTWKFALLLLGVIAVGIYSLGTSASIAIPAYQSYLIRAQISSGLETAAAYKTVVATALLAGKSIEETNLALPQVNSGRYLESLRVVSGVVVLRFGGAASVLLKGRELLLVPGTTADNDVVWVCGHAPPPSGVHMVALDVGKYTTIPDKFLPQGCRP
jgi:uncharacterized RDD family membrane protein YckC/Tfp pilus assembly major pilin PilA